MTALVFSVKALLPLALAGACSAALSVGAPLFLPLDLNKDGLFYCYKGFFFGVSLAIYFLFFSYEKVRSLLRAIAFVASCMLADWASITTAFSLLTPSSPNGPVATDANALFPFFAAGFVGSFLICLAACCCMPGLLFASKRLHLRYWRLVSAVSWGLSAGWLEI